MEVPEVLRGGSHDEITRFKRQMSLKKTAAVRPDLLETADLSAEDILYLERLRIAEKG